MRMSFDVPTEPAARPLRIDQGLRLDQDDLKILQILSHDARVTKSALAAEIGLSITPTWERVRKLEAAGLIRREQIASDSRFRLVHVTDAGRAVHDVVARRVER